MRKEREKRKENMGKYKKYEHKLQKNNIFIPLFAT
jgi:hypothetical protein